MDFVVFVVIRVIEIYLMAIAARRLLTWFEVRPDHFVARALDTFVEPLAGPLRLVVPPVAGRDIAPLVAMILLFVTWLVLRFTVGGGLY